MAKSVNTQGVHVYVPDGLSSEQMVVVAFRSQPHGFIPSCFSLQSCACPWEPFPAGVPGVRSLMWGRATGAHSRVPAYAPCGGQEGRSPATWMASRSCRQEGNVTGDTAFRIEMLASLEDSYLFLLSFSSEELAFRKKRLCIKFIPRDSTEAAICDIRIMGRAKQAPPQYTFIG